MTEASFRTRARSELYAWLAAAFYLPDSNVMTDEFVLSALPLATSLFPQTPVPRLDDLVARVQEGVSVQSKLQDIERDYARLFLGPAKVLVPPYESIYFGSELLMTERTTMVEQFYESCGLALDSAAFHEPPDHVAVELTFLAMLIDQSGERAAEEVSPLELRFLQIHLGRWGNSFAEDILTHAHESFYLTAAELLRCTIEHYRDDQG